MVSRGWFEKIKPYLILSGSGQCSKVETWVKSILTWLVAINTVWTFIEACCNMEPYISMELCSNNVLVDISCCEDNYQFPCLSRDCQQV